ncbi:MAG: sugar kinase [Bacilli bacterium]|nr:sugar kinase [Bacilli bacterium]
MKVITFGELMLRLQPYNYLRFVQCESYEATYGGGEANVAVSLSNYGIETEFVSKLPNNEIGQAGKNSLRKYGVGTKHLKMDGERCGIYFLEKGASQRASKVVYDRKYSAFYFSKPEDYDWDAIFEGADWFHISGITPAVSKELRAISIEACKKAHEHGVKVSCDLNYRGKLWTRDEARETMSEIAKYVDVCIGNEEDASDVFGISPEGNDIYGGHLNKEGYKSVARQLKDKFGFEKVAITLRTSISASENKWSAMLFDGENYCFATEYDMMIVDRVGGGDSFSGGLIYGLLNNYSTQDAIDFAVAASCLKHSIEGDYNMVTVDEVKKLIKSGGSGRVQR